MGQAADPSAASLQVPSEEEAPHSPADALSIVEDVELVHKLVHGVAGFGDGAEVGHEPHVIALLPGNRKNQFSRVSLFAVPSCKQNLPSQVSYSHRKSLS